MVMMMMTFNLWHVLIILVTLPNVWLSVFVTDTDRMIEFNAVRPYCHLHTDRGYIQSIILNTDVLKLRQVPSQSIRLLEQVCFEDNEMTGEIQGGMGFIYPGTKWCGPGNTALNYTDIGRFSEEDKCCREHDYCPEQIAPGDCLRSICNSGNFTRTHCECDEKFRKCLQSLNTEPANTIGAAFFNVVQVTCFETRPTCSKLQRIGYNITMQDEICSRYKFRPSAKYVAMQPYKSYT